MVEFKHIDITQLFKYQKMDQHEGIHRLVEKIESGLPEIKIRSITSLHTKITVGIIETHQLPRFKQMPGAILNWINDHSTRSQNLFKALTILSYFAKTQDGLVLLQQYEATDFFKELRSFLLSQNAKQDQYTNLLESMIKSLLPLHPQTPTQSQMQASNIPLEQSNVKQKEQKPASTQSTGQQNEEIVLTWVISKDPLGKKEQDELYSLYMQFRHGKRELHLEWLKRIHELVKYWGYKSFRFKNDLVSELMHQFPKSKLKWLIIEIIRSLLRALNHHSQQLRQGLLDIVNINYPKPLFQPQEETVNIKIISDLFDSVYSAPLLKDLLSFQFNKEKQGEVEDWIIRLPFRYSPVYFIESFKRLVKKDKKDVNLTVMNRQIQFYCENYPQFRTAISQIIESIPQNWHLQTSDFPALVSYLQQSQTAKAYNYISKYDSEWSLGQNLHLVSQVMNNLTKGVAGVDHKTRKNQLITLYLKCLLTLGVAVQKHDPLMNYYPTMKKLIIQIASNKNIRATFYQQALTMINSHEPIKYGSKSFICSELALMIFAEDSLFEKLLEEALNDEESCACWLEVIKRQVLNKNIESLDKYSSILYCLTYHKNNQIKQLSKYLVQKLGKKGTLKVLLCKLFSTSQEERLKMAIELFSDNSQNILKALDGTPPKKLISSKKLLRIQGQTLNNYISIIFNNNLEEHIQLSAINQLLQSIQRIELNEEVIDILVDLSNSIKNVLQNQKESLPTSIISMLIQIKEIIDFRTNQNHPLELTRVGMLLQRQHNTDAIKILLRDVYSQIFQNPFTDRRQFHFTVLLYPILKLLQTPISEPSRAEPPPLVQDRKAKKTFEIASYKQTKQIEHFGLWAFHQLINGQKVVLDQIFADIVQKQIGQIIHASKGYINLHYLNYLILFLKDRKVQIPERISQYSAPLLSSLLAKQMDSYNSQPTAQLMSLIGNKRNRQILNLIDNGSSGTWKLYLFSQLSNINSESLDQTLKNLLNINYGRQAAFTLKTLLSFLKRTEVSQFSQSLIRSACLKYFRQEGDNHLRKIALCVLTELYGSVNLPWDGESQLFASITAVITEQQLSSSIMTLALNLVKKIVLKDERVISQGSLLKLLLNRLVPLATHPTIEKLLQSSVLELFRVVISSGRQELLAGADLIDISLPLFSIVQKAAILKDGEMRLLLSASDILFFSCENEPDLPKYILSSTRLQTQLLRSFEMRLQGSSKSSFLEGISRLWLKISTVEEDLFVYKVSQLLSESQSSLMKIVSTHLKEGRTEYLKMLGWTVIIWSKHRQILEDSFGYDFATALLQSPHPQLIKMILPFSLKAKELFLSSSLLSQTIKEATGVAEDRIVRDTKQKKKKTKIYSLQEGDAIILQKTFGLISSLFYFNGEGHLEGGEGLKKTLMFLQRFYLSGAWEESIMKHFLRVMTNMALAPPLSDSVAIRLIENGTLIQQISTCIIRAENIIDSSSKLALRLASSLVHIQSVRLQFLRGRVIEQVSSKLIRSEERNQLNLEYTMEVVELLLSFSAYKDSNARILGDKRLGDILLEVLRGGKLSILEQKIVRLLANIACFKHNKNTLMNCKALHKTVLGLLEDPEISYRSQLLVLLYNLLYKNSAGLKLYRRPQVVELIQSVQKSLGESAQEVIQALLEVLQSEEG